MSGHLHIKIIGSASLSDTDRKAIISLCNRAYEEDLGPLLDTFFQVTEPDLDSPAG